MLTTQEIKTFILNDQASTKKKLARVGQRYYEADHDIKNYRIFFFDADGVLKEDNTKSNIKIAHPFFYGNCRPNRPLFDSGRQAYYQIRRTGAASTA